MRAINFGRYNLNHNLSSHFIPPATRNLVNKKSEKKRNKSNERWKRETNNQMTCEICKWITINLVECVFYIFQKENSEPKIKELFIYICVDLYIVWMVYDRYCLEIQDLLAHFAHKFPTHIKEYISLCIYISIRHMRVGGK